eukprot:g9782.t1
MTQGAVPTQKASFEQSAVQTISLLRHPCSGWPSAWMLCFGPALRLPEYLPTLKICSSDSQLILKCLGGFDDWRAASSKTQKQLSKRLLNKRTGSGSCSALGVLTGTVTQWCDPLRYFLLTFRDALVLRRA